MAYGPVSIGGYAVLPPATDTELGGIKVSDDFEITEDGVLTIAGKKTTDIFPVGSIYQTVSNISPASLYGGTWVEVAKGRVLIGADESYTAGTTVEAGLPNITGSLNETLSDGKGSPFRGNKNAMTSAGALTFTETASNYTGYSTYSGSMYDISFDASRSNPIYGASDTVQPPAYIVHIWQRVG